MSEKRISYLSCLPSEVRYMVYNYGAYMISLEIEEAQAESRRWMKKAQDTPANDDALCLVMRRAYVLKTAKWNFAQKDFMNYFLHWIDDPY